MKVKIENDINALQALKENDSFDSTGFEAQIKDFENSVDFLNETKNLLTEQYSNLSGLAKRYKFKKTVSKLSK